MHSLKLAIDDLHREYREKALQLRTGSMGTATSMEMLRVYEDIMNALTTLKNLEQQERHGWENQIQNLKGSARIVFS